MTTHAVPRRPSARAVALESHAFTAAELVALSAHEDPHAARLAEDALALQFSLRSRLASQSGAPSHTRPAGGGDSGLLHILGPAPKAEV